MSTRSAIVEITPEGKYRGVYCHSDGYPEYNGQMLVHFYDTPEKVKELIDLGFLSLICKRVKPEENELHSFKNPVDGVTIAYIRDRQDAHEGLEPITGDDFDSVTGEIDCAYCYLFKDNEWYVLGGDIEDLVLVKSLALDTKFVD